VIGFYLKNIEFETEKISNIFKTLFPTIYRDMLLFANLRYSVARIIYNNKKKTTHDRYKFMCYVRRIFHSTSAELCYLTRKKFSEVILNNQYNISRPYLTITSYNSRIDCFLFSLNAIAWPFVATTAFR